MTLDQQQCSSEDADSATRRRRPNPTIDTLLALKLKAPSKDTKIDEALHYWKIHHITDIGTDR